MNKPEYKLLPCVFCTIGFNSYVAVNTLAAVAVKKFKQQNDQKHAGTEGLTTARIKKS